MNEFIILYIIIKRKERIDINYIKKMKFVNITRNILKNKDNVKYIIIAFCMIITIVSILCLKIFNNNKGKVIINGINISKLFIKDQIGVYIDGEVKNPGVVYIPNGKDLEYALNIIGGITQYADIDNIDLKQKLKSGEKILIPSKKVNDEYTESVQEDGSKININTASKEELKELEGIGDKTAEKIIDYREYNKFDNIEEIMEVKGIGENKYEKIKEDICV